MASFPTLKTGAIAQYPLAQSTSFATASVRFLDGSSQRFPLYGSGLRRWAIKLDLLDDQELSAFIAFAEALNSGTFAFIDPKSGAAVANCIISGDQFTAGMKQELDGQATILIEETR